jgi:hypothetical protein
MPQLHLPADHALIKIKDGSAPRKRKVQHDDRPDRQAARNRLNPGGQQMIKLFLLFGALFAVSASAQEQWEHPDSRLGMTVFNTGKRPVIMKMYSQNRRGKEWGPYEVVPNTGGWKPPTFKIDCRTKRFAWARGMIRREE